MDTNNYDFMDNLLTKKTRNTAAIVIGRIDETSENLEHVSSEVEPVVYYYIRTSVQ